MPQPLGQPLSTLLARCCVLQPAANAVKAPHATRIQAAARGRACRRLLSARLVIEAEVVHPKTIESEGKTLTTYVVAVRRDGRAWEVEHRYSDWLQLDERLSGLLPQRPALPPRTLLQTQRVEAYRREALDAYLQQVLQLATDAPQVRSELLDFLTRSHFYWQYACSLYCWKTRANKPRRFSASPPKVRRGSSAKSRASTVSPKNSPKMKFEASPVIQVINDQSGKSGKMEGNPIEPFFRLDVMMKDLCGVVDGRGEKCANYKTWMPEKKLHDNWGYWMKVIGT